MSSLSSHDLVQQALSFVSPIPLKRCSTCPEGQQWHPATTEFFHCHGRTKDGFQTQCITCRKQIKSGQKEKTLKIATPICGVCGGEKVKSGEKLVCSSCNKRRSAEWAKQHPERVNERNRRHKAKYKEKVDRIHRNSKLVTVYGISIDEYEYLLQQQNYVCAICDKPEIKRHRNGTLWALSVDHDHATGEIRGLLCSACNVGIANFRENIASLESAIRYLKRGGDA